MNMENGIRMIYSIVLGVVIGLTILEINPEIGFWGYCGWLVFFGVILQAAYSIFVSEKYGGDKEEFEEKFLTKNQNEEDV